jgi:hypothetical protein
VNRVFPLAVMAAVVLAASGCHGKGAGSPVTAPSPVSPAPPLVAIGWSQPVVWDGQASYDGAGSGRWHLEITQNGAQVNGDIGFFDSAGPFAGTVSGTTLHFNFSVGNNAQGCGNGISGTANVGTNSMTGTFSGQDCFGHPVTGGTLSALFGPAQIRTQAYPVGGTWVGNVPPPAGIGGGTWTWTISEQIVDVYSSTVSGSVAVSASNTLSLGSGSFTGTVTNTFPGPKTVLDATATFTGTCASTIHLLTTFPSDSGDALIGHINGSTCNGAFPQSGVNVARQ